MPKATISSKSSFIYTCITTTLYYTVLGLSDPVVIAFYLQAFWGYFNPSNCLSKREENPSNPAACDVSSSSQILLIVCCGTAVLMLCKALLEFHCDNRNEQLSTVHAELKKLKLSLESVCKQLQDVEFKLAREQINDPLQELVTNHNLLQGINFSNATLSLIPRVVVTSRRSYWLLDQFNRYQIWLTALNCNAVLPLMWHDLFVAIRQEQRTNYAQYALAISVIAAVLLRLKDLWQSSPQTQEKIKMEAKINLLNAGVMRCHATLSEVCETFVRLGASHGDISENLKSVNNKLGQIPSKLAEICAEYGFFNAGGLNINRSAINSVPEDEQPLLFSQQQQP